LIRSKDPNGHAREQHRFDALGIAHNSRCVVGAVDDQSSPHQLMSRGTIYLPQYRMSRDRRLSVMKP
jgi:hypothetical protein